MLFGNRRSFRFAVGRGCRGEDETPDSVAQHRIEEIDSRGDIGTVISAGLLDGLLDEAKGREVHHGIDLIFAKDCVQCRMVVQIDLAKARLRMDGFAMAFREVVEGDYTVASVNQDLGARAADISRRTRD